MNTGLHEVDKAQPSRSEKDEAAVHNQEGKEPALRGTFASVMILGAFILATWAAVFVLYLVRQ